MSWKPFLIATAVALAAPLHVGAATPSVEAHSFSGEILELKDVDSYTYVRLKTRDGEIWAAVPRAPLRVGGQIFIGSAMTMKDFESRTLKRRFESIVFGELTGPDGRRLEAPPATKAAPTAPAVKVAKAPGAESRTVAEIVGGKGSLKDRSVLVRAQVVKVSLGIMGKNWLHLQDGSGSGADGTNDVLVTTQDVVAVGDIVTARGTVRTDVDLGSGYRYAVLVENAAVRK